MKSQTARHLRSIDQTLRACAVGGLLILAVWIFSDILLLIFAAVLLACVLRGAANCLSGAIGLAPRWALAVVVLIVFLSMSALLWWRGAAIGGEVVNLSEQLTLQVRQVWQQLAASAWGSLLAQQFQRAFPSTGSILTGYVPSVTVSVLGIGGSLIVVGASALFLAASPQLYFKGAIRLLPVTWRAKGREVGFEVAKTLRFWILGQFADMLIVSTLVGIGLFALGVPLAPMLALLAGILNFVPYVGALAGAIPAILVGLAQSPGQAAWVALLFVGVQMLEGNVIAPMIQNRTSSLPPALTILSQTILGTLFGVLGLVLATPLMAMCVVSVRMIYVESVLEGDFEQEPGSRHSGEPDPCVSDEERTDVLSRLDRGH